MKSAEVACGLASVNLPTGMVPVGVPAGTVRLRGTAVRGASPTEAVLVPWVGMAEGARLSPTEISTVYGWLGPAVGFVSSA